MPIQRELAEAMAQLNGLLEAALFVENLSRARDFYEQVVGLERLQESEAGCVFAVATVSG